jgi:hypothetical protein
VAFVLHVFQERLDNAIRPHVLVLERCRQVEQIAAGLALIERAELGPEQLVERIGVDAAGAGEPTRFNAERDFLNP